MNSFVLSQQLDSDAATLVPVFHYIPDNLPFSSNPMFSSSLKSSSVFSPKSFTQSPGNSKHRRILLAVLSEQTIPNDPYFPSQWSLHSELPWDTQIDSIWQLLVLAAKRITSPPEPLLQGHRSQPQELCSNVTQLRKTQRGIVISRMLPRDPHGTDTLIPSLVAFSAHQDAMGENGSTNGSTQQNLEPASSIFSLVERQLRNLRQGTSSTQKDAKLLSRAKSSTAIKSNNKAGFFVKPSSSLSGFLLPLKWLPRPLAFFPLLRSVSEDGLAVSKQISLFSGNKPTVSDDSGLRSNSHHSPPCTIQFPILNWFRLFIPTSLSLISTMSIAQVLTDVFPFTSFHLTSTGATKPVEKVPFQQPFPSSQRIPQRQTERFTGYMNPSLINLVATILGNEKTEHSTTGHTVNTDLERKSYSKFPIVAIIDAGCDISQVDLINSLWKNEGEIDCYDGIDNDNNGYIDDCYGYDFVELRPIREPEDIKKNSRNSRLTSGKNSYESEVYFEISRRADSSYLNHGTNLASLIGSTTNNSKGITGGCLGRCRVMCLRAIGQGEKQETDKNKNPNLDELNKNNSTKHMNKKLSEERVIYALRYAYSMGARISTNSYGRRGKPFVLLQQEIERLSNLDKQGLLFIVAAGNNGQNLDNVFQNDDKSNGHADFGALTEEEAFYPAATTSNPSVILVGASDREGRRLPFSNYGYSVSLFAPGVLIAAGMQGGDVDFVSGTSIAAPIVSASAALLWSFFPKLSLLEIKQLLLASTTPSHHLTNLSETGGTLNVWNALQSAALSEIPVQMILPPQFSEC